jgi:hypothetical protein
MASAAQQAKRAQKLAEGYHFTDCFLRPISVPAGNQILRFASS